MSEHDKKEDYRRHPWDTYALLAVIVLLAGGAVVEAVGTSRPFRYYSDSGNTSFTYFTNLSGNANLSAWGIDTDNPSCELDIGGFLCLNGSLNTSQGIWLNNSAIGGGGGLTSVPVVNLTRINGINNSGFTSINFTFTNGTVMSINVPDTTGGGSGSFNISNTDGQLNVTNSSGVINFNLTGGYPIRNGSAATCNSGNEYSTWNGTAFNCHTDGGLTTAVTSLTFGLGINSSSNPITTTGALGINYTTTSLDGILRASDYINLSHAGSSNLTSVTVHNITDFGVNRTAPNSLVINWSDGSRYMLSLANNIITLDGSNITNAHWGSSNLTSVLNVNLTTINVSNNTGQTQINLSYTNGTIWILNLQDTSGGGGSSVPVVNITSIGNTTTTMVTQFNFSNGTITNVTLNKYSSLRAKQGFPTYAIYLGSGVQTETPANWRTNEARCYREDIAPDEIGYNFTNLTNNQRATVAGGNIFAIGIYQTSFLGKFVAGVSPLLFQGNFSYSSSTTGDVGLANSTGLVIPSGYSYLMCVGGQCQGTCTGAAINAFTVTGTNGMITNQTFANITMLTNGTFYQTLPNATALLSGSKIMVLKGEQWISN